MKPHVHGCSGKRKYATRELADEVNATMVAKGSGKLHAYLCRHCNCWHHSRLSDEENRQRIAEIRARRARFNGGRFA